MTSTQQSLRPLQLGTEVKQDTHKLVNIQRSLGDLTAEFVNKDIDTIESQAGKIQGFAQGISSLLQNLSSYKSECSKTIAELQKETEQLNGKIKVYEREFKNSNKENQYRKQIENNEKKYLAQWEKRIQIASKIDTDALAKVQIEDRKSKANEIFKWVIVAIYNEPQTKFYWPNFKEQIFIRDEGKDFRERLGKVNASNAKEQQRVKTVDFIKAYSQISACKELKKVSSQIEEIKKVADIFLNCFEISKTIRSLEASIEQSRQQSRERDEQAMRWKARCQALQDRIITNKQYLGVLNKIELLVAGKVQKYTETQNTAKNIVQSLKQHGAIGHLDIDVGEEKRDNCQCTIF